MITILPVQKKDQQERMMRGISGAEDNAQVLEMNESGQPCGFIVIDIQHSTVRILRLVISENNTEKSGAVDNLVRSAASYGAFAGTYRMETRISDYPDYFYAAGFRETKDGIFCDLSNFIKICGD